VNENIGVKTMDLIQFPSSAQNKTRKAEKVVNSDGPHTHLYLGNWSYTCTSCYSKVEFETSTMVFRKLEFYCGGCGTMHTIVNPAFSLNKNK
jgi:hypothetical protein